MYRVNISLKSLAGSVFVFALLFPWVSFRTNSMDTQPWAFLLAIIFIALCFSEKVKKPILIVFFIPFFSLFVSVLNLQGDFFLILRGGLSYLFFATIFFASYLYIKRFGFPTKLIVFANLIYIFLGLWQMFVGDTLINFISPIRTTEGRGVTSLAVEPTNFGFVLLVFSWLYLLYNDYKPTKPLKWLIFFNLVAILLLAQSSITILYLVLAAGICVIYRINPIYFGLAIVVIFYASVNVMEFFPEARVSKLISILSSVGPFEIVYRDASINSRVASVIFPYEGLIENIFLPGGFTTFDIVSDIIKSQYGGFFWYGNNTKIMSYVGSFIYELGVVGVSFILYYLIVIQNGKMRRIFETIFLFLLLNAAVSVSSPIVALLLCSMLLTKKQTLVA